MVQNNGDNASTSGFLQACYNHMQYVVSLPDFILNNLSVGTMLSINFVFLGVTSMAFYDGYLLPNTLLFEMDNSLGYNISDGYNQICLIFGSEDYQYQNL
jgi:hypothetical protein